MSRRSNSLIFIFLFFFVFPSSGYATPEYAEQTGFECQRCHTDPTGGKLAKAGEDFREGLKAKGLYRPLHPIQRAVRLMIGYLHLLMAIAWFGTILYVHLLLKPAYAARGLPKGELILGWLGIVILSVTGVLLTTSRVPTLNVLYSTKFGILLSVKISLFLIMVTSAFIVTFLIGPRLRKQKALALPVNKSKLTLMCVAAALAPVLICIVTVRAEVSVFARMISVSRTLGAGPCAGADGAVKSAASEPVNCPQ